MRRTAFLVFVVFLTVLICVCNGVVYANDVRGSFGFEMHDSKSNDYSYPAFKFAIKTPDGTLIGWREEEGWTCATETARERTQPFLYPDPEHECTSAEPYKEMHCQLSSGIEGKYSISNALYCRNIVTNNNIFFSSAYDVALSNVPDGSYEISITADKSAILDFCFSYLVANQEVGNVLCTDGEYMQTLILTPQRKQTLEISYSGASMEKNKLKKVVTPSTLVDAWEGCNQLGMVKNQGVYNSIGKKLVEAKKKHEAGQANAAANIRNAIVNEIEAQKGKGVSAECGNILIEDLKGFEQ